MNSLLSATQLRIETGKKIICQSMNLSFHAGEVWGILGPNGVGKTTLLHALGGLHDTTSGTIHLENEALPCLPTRLVAQKIAILFQTIQHSLPQSIREYVTASRYPHLGYFELPGCRDLAVINEALSLMDLQHDAHRPVKQLSGGEMRRTAIAAVLAQTPEIYLLDEPTNHLDLHYQLRTLSYFRQQAIHNGKCIIMSLHDVNLAQSFCTHVLLMFRDGSMHHGKVCDILSEDSLSALYDVNVEAISYKDSTFWRY